MVLEKKNQEIGSLVSQLQELENMSVTIESLQERIGRLTSENRGLGEEVQTAQENLRLSANENKRILNELNEYKNRIASNNEEGENLRKKIQKLLQ